jgi:transcriptional regulator with XRE-family HTH domain
MGAARGSRTPKFGKALAGYRGDRSLEQVALRLRGLGFTTDKSTLWNYERGRAPDFGILWGLAKVYRVPFGPLCEALGAELHGGVEEPPGSGLSDAALAVGQAYDAGPPLFRDLVDHAMKVRNSLPGQAGSTHEPAREREAEDADTRSSPRTTRGRRARVG